MTSTALRTFSDVLQSTCVAEGAVWTQELGAEPGSVRAITARRTDGWDRGLLKAVLPNWTGHTCRVSDESLVRAGRAVNRNAAAEWAVVACRTLELGLVVVGDSWRTEETRWTLDDRPGGGAVRTVVALHAQLAVRDIREAAGSGVGAWRTGNRSDAAIGTVMTRRTDVIRSVERLRAGLSDISELITRLAAFVRSCD
jgi:hypothetical protein